MSKRFERHADRLKVLGLSLLLALVACGGPSGSADRIDIHGMVYTDVPVDMTCEEQTAELSGPNQLSGIEVVFSDANQTELARVSTGALQWSPLDYGCRFFASYQANLPVVSDYRVVFEVPATEHVLIDVAADEITVEEPETVGYEWDFEAFVTYEVTDPPCAFDGTDCVTTTVTP